ncbi:MAG TPA: hypothetical protein DDX39_02850 [Bacteroidales bacterium]|nr:MAG: hypothetical protein A2W98_03035 [Bacteroidetes bacterium GWF2_33_38]OFY90312.1 MAG: hypothetical protein A2236_04580 [Bacteroidetes bacterium RIFOXYA2_FULL_33_7]HBF87556.1 hypothetical protein [Bacteroidales bacterium]
MKELNNIINNNRELFDSEEPSEKHFARFSKILEKRNTKKRNIFFYAKAASIMILIALSSLWTYEHLIPEQKQTQFIVCNSELNEVEVYYTSKIASKISSIKNMNFLESELEKEILLSELHQMDTVKQYLEKELKANPNDERIISALIVHYQTKLHVIDNILSKLKMVETKKQKNYESIEL